MTDRPELLYQCMSPCRARAIFSCSAYAGIKLYSLVEGNVTDFVPISKDFQIDTIAPLSMSCLSISLDCALGALIVEVLC